MKTLNSLFTIFLFIASSAQEPVFLRDFSASGADAFPYEPQIEGRTVNNQLLFVVDDA